MTRYSIVRLFLISGLAVGLLVMAGAYNSKVRQQRLNGALFLAVGNTSALSNLLNDGANPNARDSGQFHSTILSTAAATGNDGAVALLLDNGADIEATDARVKMTPLMQAAVGGHVATVKLLLTRKADPNAKNVLGETARRQTLGYLKLQRLKNAPRYLEIVHLLKEAEQSK